MGAPNSAPQLMNLSQAKSIGAIHDDGISIRDVDTRLNNGGTDQHIGALMIKVCHDLF